MEIGESERNILLGALDSLALCLARHQHQWTEGERAIYEEACKILGVDPKEP